MGNKREGVLSGEKELVEQGGEGSERVRFGEEEEVMEEIGGRGEE